MKTLSSDSHLDNERLLVLETQIRGNKRTIETLERLFDSESPRKFTLDFMEQIERDLSKVINEVRDVPEKVATQYFYTRDGLLSVLRDVRNELNMALDQLDQKGRTQSFYRSVSACREKLATAIEYWSGPA